MTDTQNKTSTHTPWREVVIGKNEHHFCPFCRCRFPDHGPQLAELAANHQRVVAELAKCRRSHG